MYLCKFNSDGNRLATVVEGIHFHTQEEKKKYLDDGYIETSEEDYSYYIGNEGTGANNTGFIRDMKKGGVIDAPAIVVSDEEQLKALDARYESDKKALASQYLDAAMSDDNDTMAAIKTEITKLNEKYDADYKSIKGES